MRYVSIVFFSVFFLSVAACKKQDPTPAPAKGQQQLAAAKTTPNKAVDTSLPGDPLAGEKIFKEKGCMACHGMDGRGNGGVTGREPAVRARCSIAKRACPAIPTSSDRSPA